ncbi:MAG: hypothetical protein WDN49_17260 [Acetobacteraceae bacterium]
MRRNRLVDALLMLAMQPACQMWRGGRAALRALQRWGPLQRLHARVGLLPPALALPLFLVPEAASRAGWVASVWLLLVGRAWAALALYVVTKLLAGVAALWIYHACEPALLRVRWFARWHGEVRALRRSVWAGLRAALPRRVRTRQRWLRARLKAGNAAAAPVPAIPSPPDRPGPTG